MSLIDWYEVVQDSEEVLQGDLLTDCPLVHVAFSGDALSDVDEIVGDVVKTDVIVLSQSCDIANDKIATVLVGQVFSWAEAEDLEMARGNTLIRSERFRTKLAGGEVPGMALLNKRESNPRLEWSIVDFHRLHVTPKAVLSRVARQAGSRLRLKSPYREYLSQALARYFMRVALPTDCRGFIAEGGARRPSS